MRKTCDHLEAIMADLRHDKALKGKYSVLGDCVNLSARLMQLACGEEVKKIICCEYLLLL